MSSSGVVERAVAREATVTAPPLAPIATGSADDAASSLRVEWKRLVELDAAEVAAWKKLAGRALEPNVFLEPAFALAAARHLSRGKEVGALLVRQGARLVGFAPGRVEALAAGRPISTFVSWTHAYAPLSTPLLDRETAKKAVDAVLRALPLLPGKPRLILYPFVNETGAVAQLRSDELARKEISVFRFDAHRRAALRRGEDALAAISAGRLKELRRQRRRLGEIGALSHVRVTKQGELGAALAAYLAIEARGWKGRAGGAAQLGAGTGAFMQEAVTALAAEDKARIDLLTLDGQPIAAAITLFSGDRAWFWKTAYDETHARCSPGVQLALDLTEELASDPKISLVDSCAVAGHPMIDHLWGERLGIADWMIPLPNCGSGASAVAGAAEKLRRGAIAGLRKLVR